MLESSACLLEAPKCFLKPPRFKEGDTIVIEYLRCLLGRHVGYVLSGGFLIIWLLSLAILALLQELEGLAEVEYGQVVLLQFKMHHTQVVKVILWVVA
jgi:hypothetical protein